MAGTGPAPKADGRRNQTPPARGDWIELPVPTAKTPALPARGKGRGAWSAQTRREWKTWWSDPASTQWGAGDLFLVRHLADVYEEWVRDPRATLLSEIRQLCDSLGLSMKGKQDRRWRVSGQEAPTQNQPDNVTPISAARSRVQAA